MKCAFSWNSYSLEVICSVISETISASDNDTWNVKRLLKVLRTALTNITVTTQ